MPILGYVANNTNTEMSSLTAARSGGVDALEGYLARKLNRRTRRVSLAPWLYHLGLVEFSRYAHKSKGPEATRVFNMMRARDLSLVVAAYMLVPPELLGTIGLITDAMALHRLARIVPAEDIAKDRSIGAFPIAAAWALEFNSDRARIPVATLVPGLFHSVFALRNKLETSTTITVVTREAISDGVVTYILAAFSNYLRKAITQQFLAVEGARRSLEIAADRRSRARLWLVGTHTRLNALAASRWAVESVKDEPGPARFIETVAAEEIRLREMFESSAIPLDRVVARILNLRDARKLPTILHTDNIEGKALDENAEAAIEWLIEAVCPFVSGQLEVKIAIADEIATITLEAENLPSELMSPFQSYPRQGRQRIQASMTIESRN